MPVRKIIEDWTPNPEDTEAVALRQKMLDDYDSDNSITAAKIQQLEEQNGSTARELNAQKVRNYDLLQRVPAESKQPEVSGGKPESSEVGWDDLFGENSKG